ncbi:MAG: hypothetical protein H0U86_15265 [Chloroflexi bacterium]|nr:hypothetical protein [Chloroflexota bacterium]
MRVWQDEREARIAVVDHGAGVPLADRERIFERFYRAPNAQSITDTGMGLGLYICRRIVEEHGGRIWAEATPSGGATFVFSIPLEPDAAAESHGSERPMADLPSWSPTAVTEAAADA